MVRRYAVALIGITSLLAMAACGTASPTSAKHHVAKAAKAGKPGWTVLAKGNTVANPTALLMTSDGVPIVGTMTGNVQKPVGNQWPVQVTVGSEVVFLGQASNGDLIIGAQDDLGQLRFYKRTPGSKAATPLPPFPAALLNGDATYYGTAMSPSGAIYVATSAGFGISPTLWTLTPTSTSWTHVSGVSPSGPIAYADGTLAVTIDSGFLLLSDNLQKQKQIGFPPALLKPGVSPKSAVTSVAVSPQGHLLVGTMASENGDSAGFGVWEYGGTWTRMGGNKEPAASFNVSEVAASADAVAAVVTSSGPSRLWLFGKDGWKPIGGSGGSTFDCFPTQVTGQTSVAFSQTGVLTAICSGDNTSNSSSTSVVAYGPRTTAH